MTTGECSIPCGISTPTQKPLGLEKAFMTPSPIMGMTEGRNVMASASSTPVSCNWQQDWRAVPGVISGFGRRIAITPKQQPNAIGAQRCWSDWFRAAGATEARASVSHQGNSNSLLPLTYATIKSQRSGIKLRWDFARRMVSVMAIRSEGFGSYVEGLWIDVGLKILRLVLLCLAFLGGWIRRVDGWKLWLFCG